MPSLSNVKTEKEIKEIFSLFDLNGCGYIETKDLGTLIRALWKCPTEAEVFDYKKELDPDGTERISFEGFLSFFNKIPVFDIKKAREDLLSSFRVFDKNNNGLIQEKELKHLLTNLGEKLSEDDVNELIQEVDKDKDGWIEYSKLIDKMIMPSD